MGGKKRSGAHLGVRVSLDLDWEVGGSMWEKDRKSRGGRGLCIGRLGRVLAS